MTIDKFTADRNNSISFAKLYSLCGRSLMKARVVNKRYLLLLISVWVLVAKRKSLFDDKADEIQQLTFVIKQDLGTLNKQIAQLQEVNCTHRCTDICQYCLLPSLTGAQLVHTY